MAKLFGLLGEKLSHSLSPKIHTLLFDILQMEAYYHLFEIEKNNLKAAVKGLKALGVKGVNVTIPYKVAVMEYLDEIAPEAQKIGAVNTICFDGHKTTGCNTDYHGFGMTLEKYGIETKGKTAAILGSGGAAKSVIQYLKDHQINEIRLVSRDVEKLKGTEMAECRLMTYDELQRASTGDILINCTPCGMYPNPDCSPVEKTVISKYGAAVDLIYNPKETRFLKHAIDAGIPAVNGLYMLVGQAAAAEGLWNGIKIEKNIVEHIYNALDT